MAEINEALRTWTEDSVWRSGPAAFRALRTMRAKPPGAAQANDDRADTFRAALEQAQQQITGARSVGYETRPLNLFYGLSQAGRAVAAAAIGLPDRYAPGVTPSVREAQTPWELRGHGIDASVDTVTPTYFAGMAVTADRPDPAKHRAPSGSFARLAALLSPGCDVRVGITMEQLWGCLVDAIRTEPLTKACPSVLTLQPIGVADRDPGYFDALVFARNSPQWEMEEFSDREVRAFLAEYPTLKDYRLRLGPGDPFDWPAQWGWWGPAFEIQALFNVSWPRSSSHFDLSNEGDLARSALSTDYRGRDVVLPRFSANDTEPLHPLLIWWAILFGLSMLCRYRPVVWTDLIDVNHSPHASAIEHLLDVGLDAVPDLVERTIREVAV